MLGADAGLLWVVSGVWTVRAVAGNPVGLGWGIAVVGAGLRWGTLALTDLEVATRVAGPSLLAGTPAVRLGLWLALAGALIDEARSGDGQGLLARTWAPRAAGLLALVALVPTYLVRGAAGNGSSPAETALWWVCAAAALTAAALLVRPLAARAPSWAAPIVAAVGIALTLGAS